MKADIIHQEILLITTTSFSKREWYESGFSNNIQYQTYTEQLEDACWNGFLHELLPEIIPKSDSGKRLSMWQIRQGESFLQIELSEFPRPEDKSFSMNSIFFLPEDAGKFS